MKHATLLTTSTATSILPYAAAGLALLIFVVDTITDLEIAVAVFYIAVVLLSVSFLEKRGVVLVSLACMALTLVSFYLTPKGAQEAGFVNCMISCSAIAVSAYLALKIESAEVAAHEARAQLAHSARLTALGELTASIAHEVNQPLAAIVTSGDTCLRWLDAQPPNLDRARRAVDRIVADANRATEVTLRVRSLARRAPLQKVLFNLNEAILEILGLKSTELQANHVSLQVELADDLPMVCADRVQLQQVLLNLIVNSIEALESVHEGPRELIIRSKKDGPNNALVTVSDSGKGFETESVDHLFDAFYTTKGNGLGIGLAIARTIVEAHGGRVWAAPGTPRGAIIEFNLPLGESKGS